MATSSQRKPNHFPGATRFSGATTTVDGSKITLPLVIFSEIGIGKSFQVTRARWILGGFTIKSGCYYHQALKKMDVRYFSGQLLPSLLLYAMLFPLAPFSRDHSSLQTAEAVKSDQQCSFRYIIYIYI